MSSKRKSRRIAHHILGLRAAHQAKRDEIWLNSERLLPIFLIMAEHASFELPTLPSFTVPGSMAQLRRSFPEIRVVSTRRANSWTVSIREACITMSCQPTDRFVGDPGVEVQCRIEPGIDPKGRVLDFIERFRDHFVAESPISAMATN